MHRSNDVDPEKPLGGISAESFEPVDCLPEFVSVSASSAVSSSAKALIASHPKGYQRDITASRRMAVLDPFMDLTSSRVGFSSLPSGCTIRTMASSMSFETQMASPAPPCARSNAQRSSSAPWLKSRRM